MQPSNQSSASASSEALVPTTTEIFQECRRFRILVLGKSGVGKSTLINKAFGVELATTSDLDAGVSNINTEITSERNKMFVLHDSQGFEAGESGNFAIVQDFIQRRSEMPKLEDRLHAIWLCLEIPTAGGRVFETGDEDFLRLDLGVVPVIVVFTKYDLFQTAMESEAIEDDDTLVDLDDTALQEKVNQVAKAKLKKLCVDPLEAITTVHPHVTVSTSLEYKDTLDTLVQTTRDNVTGTVATLMWAIAQRRSAKLNIQASIEVGKKKYWRGLASSVNFPGKTLEKCLDAIHVDIVNVWNFYDPNMYLTSPEFRAQIYQGIDDLEKPDGPNTTHHTSAGLAGLAGVAGVISAVAPPAAAVVVPVAAGVLLAKWACDVYQRTPRVLRCLMGYIVDLTQVMQNIFWGLQEQKGAQMTFNAYFDQAVKAYHNSADATKNKNHQEIAKFAQERTLFQYFQGPDHALEKVIDLINQSPTHTQAMKRIQALSDSQAMSRTTSFSSHWSNPTQGSISREGSSSSAGYSGSEESHSTVQGKGSKGKGKGKGKGKLGKFKALFKPKST